MRDKLKIDPGGTYVLNDDDLVAETETLELRSLVYRLTEDLISADDAAEGNDPDEEDESELDSD